MWSHLDAFGLGFTAGFDLGHDNTTARLQKKIIGFDATHSSNGWKVQSHYPKAS